MLALLGCSVSPPPPLKGRLLFVSERGEQPQTALVEIGADTISPLQVPGAAFPGPPDPRGTHALLVATEEGPKGHRETLWLVPLEGDASPSKLAPPAGVIRNPSFSPDGSFVVFEADPFSYRDLYRAERSGGAEPRRLTKERFGSFEPVVSPDGARIAFGTSRDGNAEIYVMLADGAQPSRRTEHPADDVRPAWPDRDTIAWLSSRSGRPQLFLMGSDGQDPHPLRAAEGSEIDLDHAWSPDGSRVAITIQTGPSELCIDIWTRDGARVARIDGPGVDEQPSWSPDGASLAFTSSREGNPDIYVVRADGTDIERLTHDKAPEWLPRWLRSEPTPKR